MTLKRLSSKQVSQLRGQARAGNVVAQEAVNSIDNEINLNGTTAAISLYVDPTGNDQNRGTSVYPFKTIQAAVDSLPKRIRHQVDIILATGNYAGCTIAGFTFDPAGTAPCGIRMYGTLIAATVATGTTSGTFSAATAGSAATADMAVLTDAAQTWTVDNLTGKFIRILTGTNSGQIIPIISNTATAVTVVSNGTAGAVAGTYDLVELGSFINTGGAAGPSSLPAVGATVTAGQAAGLKIFNDVVNTMNLSDNFRFEQLKIAPTLASSANCVVLSSGRVSFSRCQFGDANSNSSIVSLQGAATNLSCSQCVFQGTTASGTLLSINNSATGNFVTCSACLMNGSNLTIGLNVVSGGGTTVSLAGCSMSSGTGVNIENECRVFLSGSRITGNGGRCVLARPNSGVGGNNAGVFISASGLYLANGTNGLELQGLHVCKVATLKGSGHTVAIALQRGGRAEIGSASDITGTTQVTLDGVSTDLATMRAASPKLLTNTYGTIIFE